MNDIHDNTPSGQSPEAITFARVKLASVISLGFALIALLFLGWRTWELDDYLTLFEDFDTELPALTLWVLRIPTAAYLFACGFTAAMLTWKEIALRDKGLSVVINVTAIGIAGFLWVLVQTALWLPLELLLKSVQ